MHTLRYVIRKLLSNPFHTATIVMTLALGIGAAVAVYAVVDSLILRPAPYAHADRLVDILDTNRATRGGSNSLTPEKIRGWQTQRSLFEAFEAYAPRQFDLTGGDEPERINGLMISTGLLPMIGVQPRIGRGFTDEDGKPASEAVVLLSEGLWQRKFGGTTDALGMRIVLNDAPYIVIGVMPRRFHLLNEDEAVWLPVNLGASRGQASIDGLYGLGRLLTGLTVEQAQQQSDAIADRLQLETPLSGTWDLLLQRKRVAQVNATTTNSLFILLGAVGFLLLITCANVANLFLAQSAARRGDMAVRMALGAGRKRLICLVMLESAVLAGAAGLLGVALASWGIQAIVALAPSRLAFMSTTSIELDTRVLIVAVLLTMTAGVLFGTVPALYARSNVERTLRASASSKAAPSLGRLPGLLIVAEVAISLVLLVGAALMMRTLANLHRIEPGFEPNGLIAFHIDLPTDRYQTEAARGAFFENVIQRLKGVPGVSGATIATGVPPSMGGFSFGIPQTEGAVSQNRAPLMIPFVTVRGNYFETLRIPLIAGRTFSDDEDEDAVIVNDVLARRFWPEGSAIGKRFRLGTNSRWRTIAGVVGTVEARAARENRTDLQMYYPFVRRRSTSATTVTATPATRAYAYRLMVVRADQPAAIFPQIERQIWAIDSNQAIGRPDLVEDLYSAGFSRERFLLVLMTVFAGIAVVLTGAGIFAVLSQVVAQRTREVGIRIALGARPAHIVQLIVVRAMRLVIIGAILGTLAGISLSHLLTAMLFEVSPYDPFSFAAVIFFLIAIALFACWVPARRAVRIGPAAALHAE